MMKKLFLIVLTFFVTVQGQSQDQDSADIAFQELIYDMGMCLANQNAIVDISTGKYALLNLYQDIIPFMQIIDLFMMIDEKIVEKQITTIEELLDYEINNQKDLAQAGVIWLSSYQKLFIVFKSLHPEDPSFDAWCDDMAFFASLADDEEPTDSDYLQFWHAACAILEAQIDFENVLKDIE